MFYQPRRFESEVRSDLLRAAAAILGPQPAEQSVEVFDAAEDRCLVTDLLDPWTDELNLERAAVARLEEVADDPVEGNVAVADDGPIG